MPRAQPLDVRLTFEDASGVQQVVAAIVVDANTDGLGIQIRSPLQEGRIVTLRPGPDLQYSGLHIANQARVRWCRPGVAGVFSAGLQFETVSANQAHTTETDAAEPDYYEILQVNPTAGPETVHRIYRLLAQQFHPDNKESGDEEMFKLLTRAYATLGTPSLRAAYDARYAESQRNRWRIFHSPESAQGPQAELLKRQAVVSALYRKRVQDMRNPTLSPFELEDLLGVPRDHLEFTLWYLKERGYLTRSDNNRLQITVSGVDYAETLEKESPIRSRAPEDRLITVGSGTKG